MKRLLSFTFIITIPFLLKAQNAPVYLSMEGGGNGIIASANIAKILFTQYRYKVIFQTGLGWTPANAKSESPFNIPGQLSVSFGQKGLYMEAGVGSTMIFKSRLHKSNSDSRGNEIYLSPIVGFRHESDNWFARVYLCPLYHLTGDHIYDEVTKDCLKFGVGIGAIL